MYRHASFSALGFIVLRGFASFTRWNLEATLRQASVSCTFPAASAHFMSLSCFGNPRAISGCFMTISDTAASHL